MKKDEECGKTNDGVENRQREGRGRKEGLGQDKGEARLYEKQLVTVEGEELKTHEKPLSNTAVTFDLCGRCCWADRCAIQAFPVQPSVFCGPGIFAH